MASEERRTRAPQPGEEGYVEFVVRTRLKNELGNSVEREAEVAARTQQIVAALEARVSEKERAADILLPLVEELVAKLDSGEPASTWLPGFKTRFKDALVALRRGIPGVGA